MSSALIFLDTKTTGLGLQDDIWEVYTIRREVDGTEHGLHWFVDHDPDKAKGLPGPFFADYIERFDPDAAVSRLQFAQEFAALVGDDRPHIVGANPAFDIYRIELNLLAPNDVAGNWHYHLIDVEPLMLGYLAGVRAHELPTIPYKSDELSRLIGVEPPEKGRHTAQGDVEWVKAIFDEVYR